MFKLKRLAFTMAEILLSLTIIGIVAAITLPSLTGNINERTWNTQRKALYSRLSQAVSLLPSIKGYAPPEQETSYYGGTTGSAYSKAIYRGDAAAQAFVTNGLSGVLKINNVCDSEHLSDCGFSNNMKDLSGGNISLEKLKNMADYFSTASLIACNGPNYVMDAKAVAFETANGESILIHYNPMCQPGHSGTSYLMKNFCVNFIYDLNGKKGPNSMGKDIGFMSLFNPSDSVLVAPIPLYEELGDLDHNAARAYCKSMDGARLPNKEEMMSIGFNTNLMGVTFSKGDYWTGTPLISLNGDNLYWEVYLGGYKNYAPVYANPPSYKMIARCVRAIK